MLRTVVILSALCSLVQSSGVGHVTQLAPAPVVAAASSQYFERTFNRLVAAHPVLEPVIPVAPAPPVFVESVAKAVPAIPVNPTNVPVQPNVAVAIATAHAAAPVATILLPPYPFGPPPTIGFIPPQPPNNVPDENKKESTTRPTTKFEVTTPREPEATTPLPSPSNTDNSFAQALPSNQNVDFMQQYGPPPPPPQAVRPQKLRTSVEVVPVPLAYIAPPPLYHSHGHLHAHSHAHSHAHAHSHSHVRVKPIRYVHTFVPSRAKIIIRPVSAPLRIRTVSARLTARVPAPVGKIASQNVLRSRSDDARDVEPTTFRPFNRPITKPPRQ